MLKRLLLPIYNLFLRPSFRYSHYFSLVRSLTNYFPKEETVRTAMAFTSHSKMEGDYLEFGVWNGKTFAAAYHFAQLMNMRSMKFYAFDSFEGLPKITGVDRDDYKEFRQGEYACNIDTFKKNILKKKVSLNKVHLIPGWFDKVLNEETKNKLPLKKAAIILIDCDLYESTVPVLNFITDYIQSGTVVIFDDWFRFRADPNRGQQMAFKEWLDRNKSIKAIQYHKYVCFGNSFILNKAD